MIQHAIFTIQDAGFLTPWRAGWLVLNSIFPWRSG